MAITQRSELNQPDSIVDPSAKGFTSEKMVSDFALWKYAVLADDKGNLILNEWNQTEQTQQANGVGEENLALQLLSSAHLWPPELRRTLPVNSEECSVAFVPACSGPTVPSVTTLRSQKRAAGCRSHNPNLFPSLLPGSNPTSQRRGLPLCRGAAALRISAAGQLHNTRSRQHPRPAGPWACGLG